MADTFRESFNEFMQDRVCTFLGNGANFYGAFERAVGRAFDGDDALRSATLGQMQIAYRNFCNREPPPANRSGGECPVGYVADIAVAYYFLNGTFAYRTNVTGDCAFFPGRIFGPISGPSQRTEGLFTFFEVTGFDSQGNQRIDQVTDKVNINVYRTPVIEMLNFRECVPGSATCERDQIDPLPIPFPVTLPSINFTYNNGGDTFNFDANVTVEAPQLNIDGRFTMPIRVDLGGNTLNIDPVVNLEFGLDSNGGGIREVPAPTSSPRLRDPIERITRDRNGNEPPPAPEPPEGSIIELRDGRVYIGILVVSEVSPEYAGSVIFQNSNPDIYVPSLGHVNFWYRIGERTSWSEDLRVKNTYQFIPSEDPLRTIAAYGTPQPGVESKYFPVYVSIEDFLGYSVRNTP